MLPELRFPLLALSTIALLAASGCSDASDDTAAEAAESEINPRQCASTPNSDGWCWATKNHPPKPSDFAAVADDDIWATGSNLGTLLHYDGTEWRELPVATDEDRFYEVWAASKTDVWAIGSRRPETTPPGEPSTGIVFHYDGKSWLEVHRTRATLSSIWGSGPNDVWLGGSERFQASANFFKYRLFTIHWDGVAFTEVPIEGDHETQVLGFERIHGTGPNDVWAVGPGAANFHFDGKTWSKLEGVGGSNTSVLASGPNDVWFGNDLYLLHYDGKTATKVLPEDAGAGGFFPVNVSSIVKSGNDVLVAGRKLSDELSRIYRWDGTKLVDASIPELQEGATPWFWAPTLEVTPLGTVALAYGPGDVYLGTNGPKGAPETWRRTTEGPQVNFDSIVSSRRGDILLGGNVAAVHQLDSRGRKWTRTSVPTNGGAFVTGSLEKPLVAGRGVRVFDRLADGSWQGSEPFPAGNEPRYAAPSGPSADRMWASTNTGVWERKGETWSELPPLAVLRRLTAFGEDQVFASELHRDKTHRFVNGAWVEAWPFSFRTITRAADGSMWAVNGSLVVGAGADYMYHDGQPVRMGRKENDVAGFVTNLTSCPDGRIYGVAPDRDRLRVLAFDGTTWKLEPTGVTDVRDVHCDATGQVWAVGDGGVVAVKPKPFR